MVAGVLAQPDWGEALRVTIIPQPSAEPSYISLLVANIGTTISPYMIFLVASNVVEKNLDTSDIPAQRADNVAGAILAEVITWFIMLTTGAVLFRVWLAHPSWQHAFYQALLQAPSARHLVGSAEPTAAGRKPLSTTALLQPCWSFLRWLF